VKLKLLYDPFLTLDSGVKQAIRISEAEMDAESQLLKFLLNFVRDYNYEEANKGQPSTSKVDLYSAYPGKIRRRCCE